MELCSNSKEMESRIFNTYFVTYLEYAEIRLLLPKYDDN